MVGLVVVCHSRALARAAVALAAQMVPERAVPIEVAAGLDETTFGTDAVAITAAIAAADHGDGVVVLMDLGSAVLSAELAVEMLDDGLRDRVVLCPGPLVEGLVSAMVAAAGGAGRAEVAAEATTALAGKQTHLAAPNQDSSPNQARPVTSGTRVSSGTFTVADPHGLHARPAARLVTLVRAFDADVQVRDRDTGSPWVPASSLSRVATLGARAGHRIEVRASGAQARQAVDQIVALAARAFDEPTPIAPAPVDATAAGDATEMPADEMRGQAASPGIGVGHAWHPEQIAPALPDLPAQDSGTERHRIEDALATVHQELRALRAAAARDAGDAAAQIFDAHRLLLDDAELLDDVRDRIDRGSPAPQAWAAAAERIAAGFDALPDPYLSARAADVRAVAAQVLRALLRTTGAAPPDAVPPDAGVPDAGVPDAGTPDAGVLIAADLTPAEAATLDPALVAGVLLGFGSPTGHGAILARARGIPAVVGLGAAVLAVPTGTPVALDGSTGEVAVAPSGPVLASFRRRASEFGARRERAAARAAAPAVTRDGVSVAVGANVGSVAEARAAAAGGADLAGLVRTEFLFAGRDAAPGADEQEAAYRAVAEAFGGRRITVRTLDAGGDKPLPYLPVAVEANPFLGVRGIRRALAHPALLAQQLTAIVRVARGTPVSVMFPMVSTVDEVVRARRLLDDALARAGGKRPAGLRVGMMVEVPAAALKTAAFVPYVDFLSIGTNDLTQYALAAERGNPALASLADPLDPGVLRLIDAVCRGAGGRVHVGVCGEVAADETAVPLLVGLGVRDLSVAPPAVPIVKEAVRGTVLDRAAATATRALAVADAAAVRALLAANH
ncbi:phosphoenolpyruvate--protein phosphotransferase [Krasilnikovia sp. M28-CT-15]|uniref:phosphoenolpyruvate--protein phosphotransferase n=1 Tax=Krasilnikovia sp. M28-CT-15 TaxID=3373540 RepID=UPI0038761D70